MKKIGIKDIADYCGVSIATVSYVINGKEKVSPKKRQEVWNAIKELKYNPNMNARALSKGESKLIGILLPLVEEKDRISNLISDNPFYMEFISGVAMATQDRGYDILIAGANNKLDFKRWISQRSLDGVITFGAIPSDFYQIIKDEEVPCCLVDSDEIEGFLSVSIDDELGCYLATKHLLDLNHKKIGFACASLDKSHVNQKRWKGYKRALSEYGIDYDKNLCFEDDVSYDSGRRIAVQVLKDKSITGLVCTSDTIAIGVIKEYNERQIKIPEHLSIVGFDDIKISSFITPGLTTVKQDVTLKAKMATDYLISSLTNKEREKIKTVLTPTLIIRNSTKEN